MGSSGALVCSTACVLILLSSATTDNRDLEQREVTFDKIMQEMEQPHDFIMQEEADLADIFDLKEFPGQVESTMHREHIESMINGGGSRPGVLTPTGRRPSFEPRSVGGPLIFNYPVQFPLGRPTSDNLQAICLNGEHRPSYPKSYFPASAFSQQKQKASTVNKAESWFRTCCKGNQTWEREVTLCCATQAWELSAQSFCEEDITVKHRVYHCCKLRGDDMLNCFQDDAPNPNYEATEELPVPPLPSTDNFSFDPNTCQRTVMTPQSIRGQRRKVEKKPSAPQKVDIGFPPGRPTDGMIVTLCTDRKQHPLYKTNCLPAVGYEWLARQAKTINRIEKGFKQCCKKKQSAFICADQKWREELDKYCVDENGGKVDFHCCLSDVSNDRYNCFQDVSPDPHHIHSMANDTEELSLHHICDTHKIVKKKFPVGFPFKSFVNQCCHLSEEYKAACFERKLEEISEMCSSGKTLSPAVRRCCRTSSQRPAQCISKILMDAISKATTVLRQKKKKRCPLS